MRYFKNKSSGEVFGYDANQADLIASAASNPSMEEITASWPPAVDPVLVKEAEVRSERNALLSLSDWTQVADAPVNKSAWATYRQALRDITQQSGFPNNVIWPTKPE